MITDLLHTWVAQRISDTSLTWLNQKREQIANDAPIRIFFSAFSLVPRYTGKDDLDLITQDLKIASQLRHHWLPSHWSVDQAARTLLLLSINHDDTEKYIQTLDKLFIAADVAELVTLYQALPLLPYPEKHIARAAEGIRSSMTAVFNAVALRNPYPAEYLDNLAWNQMVLKALFVGSPLNLIQGLNERTNCELKNMLIDYAHERLAAKRSVSSELWQLVGSGELGVG